MAFKVIANVGEDTHLNWILNCLVVEHDWRLTLLAAAVCVVGLATCITLIGMARHSAARMRMGYGAAAGLVGGLAVWATHFLAMLGYRSDAMIEYAVGETLLSLGIVIIGLVLGVAVALNSGSRLTRGLVAALAATSVAAMHFVGMAAMRIEGGVAGLEPGRRGYGRRPEPAARPLHGRVGQARRLVANSGEHHLRRAQRRHPAFRRHGRDDRRARSVLDPVAPA